MKHATVHIGGMVIPLIGIPMSATEEECDCCHDIFHIRKIHWSENGKQLLCGDCDKENHDPA